MRADDFQDAFRTAQTPAASTVHEPVGKPGGPGLWHHKNLQLPAYIQHVANELRGQGHGESEAVEMAVGIVKNWAAGHDGHGHAVHPDVQAAAAKNVAEWEKLRAQAHASRFNPYHKPPGPLGGEFTSGGAGGGGSKAKGKRPAAAAARPSSPHGGAGGAHRKAALLAQAHADRQKAHQLEAELKVVEAQLHQAHAAAVKAAHAAKAASAKKKTAATAHKSNVATHHKSNVATHHATTAAALQAKAGRLRSRIHELLGQARALDKQAAAIRSADAGWAQSWHVVWHQGSEAASGG